MLRLPSEIREKILINVVGENLIHVKYLDRFELNDVKTFEAGNHANSPNYLRNPLLVPQSEGAFRHAICTATQSEQSAYDETVSGHAVVPADDSSDSYVASCKKRHEKCKMRGSNPWGLTNEDSKALRVDLRVLGVCRQIYEEANHLLWSTNTFSFDHPTSFNKFLQSLNPAQKRNLTALHFNTFICAYSGPYEWGVALKISYINMLRGIETLHFSFERDWERDYPYGAFEYSREGVEADMERDIEPFLRLRALPAKNVTVVLSDNQSKERSDGTRWTLGEKLAYAEDIRIQMLNPQGADLVKLDDEVRKASERRQAKEWAETSAEFNQDRATQALERAETLEKDAALAESAAKKALKKLKKAKDKTVQEMTELQNVHNVLERQASWSRNRANRAAEDAKRQQAKADDKAAKAERAKARFEGRKVKKAGKGDKESDADEGLGPDQEEELVDEDAMGETHERDSDVDSS